MRTEIKSESPKTNRDNWFTPGRFAMMLGILIVATFFPVVVGVKTFVFGDSTLFGNPLAYYYRESLRHGQFPLWNPLGSCGIPFTAEWNTMTLYPPSLFYVLFPFPWSYGIFRLGHLFLAGMGMYFLARRWTGNNLAAAISGAVFAFNGLSWYSLMWPNIVAGLAWMPWFVLTAERAFSGGLRDAALAAIIGALQILSGGAEVIIQTWLLISAIWLINFALGKISRGRLVVQGLVMAVLTIGLAAVQIFPFLDLLKHSQRQSGFGSSTTAALPLMGWANYFVPLFHFAPGPNGVYVQNGQNWTGSYYLGVGTIVLAVLAAWRIRDRKVLLLGTTAWLGLLMAMGGHFFLYETVHRVVPLLGFMRFPAKFVIVVTFCVPLLAGYGLKWVINSSNAQPRRNQRQLLFLGAGSMILIAFIAWLGGRFPVAGETAEFLFSNAALRAVFLGLVIGCLLLLLRPLTSARSIGCQIALVLLIWLDVATHAPDLSPTADAATMEPDTVRQYFHWPDSLAGGQFRAMTGKSALWKMLASSQTDVNGDTLGRRLALLMNLNLLDHVPKVDGFYPVDLNDYLDVFKHLYFTTNAAEGLKDFLGVLEIGDSTNVVAWVARPTALPLVTCGQKPVFAEKSETLTAIFAENFAPLKVIYLPMEARNTISATNAAHGKIVSCEFTAHQVQIEMETDAPVVTAIAQNYYHAWRAYIDGRPTELWRANYAFQALQVPAGSHKIVLIYEDKAFWWGTILSLVSLAVAVAIWVLCRPQMSTLP